MKQEFFLSGVIGASLAAACPAALVAATTVQPEARVQTVPMPHGDDAADDPAVWIHPQQPELSLIFGTDKQGGLHAYNMDGSEHQLVSDGTRPNNVDVLYGFKLDGRTVDLVLAGARASARRGMKVWAIDAATRSLSEVQYSENALVLGGNEPMGVCGYRSARTGKFYFFVNDPDGLVEQFELADAGGGRINGTKVRTLTLDSQSEGCVADDELGFFYIGEESAGIWKFGAEPDSGVTGQLVARVGQNGLEADVEGLTIYYGAQGRGYLIASSQGNNTYTVYERAGANQYVLTIDPKGGQIDDVSDTDGICVISSPTSQQFAKGVFIVQDGENAGGNQNFKLYAWEDIAGTSLVIDTTWQPRAAPATASLTLQQSGNGISISWPAQLTDYRLQANDDLSAGTWSDVSAVNNQFNDTFSAPKKFYRLIRP
ncbi:MAG TPA: phytase [Verrucomicrobiae bacterium]|nr:phytase [Verrucomicrobiae bacterium]